MLCKKGVILKKCKIKDWVAFLKYDLIHGNCYLQNMISKLNARSIISKYFISVLTGDGLK